MDKFKKLLRLFVGSLALYLIIRVSFYVIPKINTVSDIYKIAIFIAFVGFIFLLIYSNKKN